MASSEQSANKARIPKVAKVSEVLEFPPKQSEYNFRW